MIELDHVDVALGGRPIVAGIDLVLERGAVTAIIGPNGSGKTTLLRAITGDLAYRGRILIDGLEVARARPWRLAAIRAVLPQATTLAFPFTVREIVGLGLAGRRDEAIIGEALRRVDLTGFAGRFYQELSGGEQQRVQLARVLCQVWSSPGDTPHWLFLDEPVSSLDIRHQLLVMEIARDHANSGGGVVVILHDLNLAAMVADRLLVMKGGRLAASGPPADVLDDALLADVYGCALRVGALPAGGAPFVLPQAIAAR